MQKEELLDDTVQFKRMRQKNKSELALYFAKNLGETKGIDCLAQAFGKPKQRVVCKTHIRRQIFIIKQMTASL